MTPTRTLLVPAEAVIISAPSAKVTSAAKLVAPSISTTSRLAVPSTSIEPAKSISPLKVAVCAKVTPPPSAMVMASSPSVYSMRGVCMEELLSIIPLVCRFKEEKASTIAPPEPAPSA